MGCDIHGFTEKKNLETGRWSLVEREKSDDFEDWDSREPFRGHRDYGLFGFLAGVRNYSEAPTIKKPTYELPLDVSEKGKEEYGDGEDHHSLTTFTLKELLMINLDEKFYDMRVTRGNNGAARAESLEEAEHISLRDFLGPVFEQEINALKHIAKTVENDPDRVRIVIWFDN